MKILSRANQTDLRRAGIEPAAWVWLPRQPEEPTAPMPSHTPLLLFDD